MDTQTRCIMYKLAFYQQPCSFRNCLLSLPTKTQKTHVDALCCKMMQKSTRTKNWRARKDHIMAGRSVRACITLTRLIEIQCARHVGLIHTPNRARKKLGIRTRVKMMWITNHTTEAASPFWYPLCTINTIQKMENTNWNKASNLRFKIKTWYVR